MESLRVIQFYFFRSTSEIQPEYEQTIKTVLSIVITIIGIVLFGSIIFGLAIFTRFILYSSSETVGRWKTLSEETNV
jgi:hypothetical protein